MSTLVKVFEGHVVRVQAEESGDLWFAAKDVCGVLGYSNARDAIAKHVDPEDVTKRDSLTLGGSQELTHLNESGVYSLILNSRLEGAKRFKRWVTSEVLPSIRKTGSYSTTPANDNHALPADAWPYDLAARVLRSAGVSAGIVAACIMTQLQTNTGTNMDELRKALPSTTEPVATLNATELGMRVGIGARAVNARLEALGLQIRSGKDWALTDAGRAHGSAFPYQRNGHTSHQVRWKESAAELLTSSAA